MLTLAGQVQRASDTAKFAAVRIGGVENVPFADEESSFAELQDRHRTNAGFPRGGAAGGDRREGGGRRSRRASAGSEVTFGAADYALQFALPNFFFHVATAYGLLRHEGRGARQDGLYRPARPGGRDAHRAGLSVRPRRHAGRQRLSARARLEGGARRRGHRALGLAHPPQDRHERRAVHQPAPARDRARHQPGAGRPAAAGACRGLQAVSRRDPAAARGAGAAGLADGRRHPLGDRDQRADGDGGGQPRGPRASIRR